MAAQTIPLAGGKLFALVHPFELDGRAASHPLAVRGWSTMNCYLLVEDDRALLFSTGFSVHQDALLAQLDELVGDRSLLLVIPRVEYPSMCNARPIADRFPVEIVYQRVAIPSSEFLNFRPEFPRGEGDGLAGVERLPIRETEPVAIDRAGRRQLEFVLPELRLLPSNWAYDVETKTLFTGDMYSWVWWDTPGGPWLLADGEDDPTTPERLSDFLLHNRYWWLAGADTSMPRRALVELFEHYEVEIVAPDYGAVLTGTAIERHVAFLDDFLAEAPELTSVGVEAGRWSTAGVR